MFHKLGNREIFVRRIMEIMLISWVMEVMLHGVAMICRPRVLGTPCPLITTVSWGWGPNIMPGDLGISLGPKALGFGSA